MVYGGLNKSTDAAAELGRNPVSKHQIQLEYGDEQADAGRNCRTSREAKFSGANGERELFIFPVRLTTGGNGNLNPVDPYSCYICVTILPLSHDSGRLWTFDRLDTTVLTVIL